MTDPRFDTERWPVEIRYSKEKKELAIRWDDGRTMAYPIRDGIPIMLVDEARSLDDEPAKR